VSRTPKDAKDPKEEAASPAAPEPAGEGAPPEKGTKKERGGKGKEAKEGKEGKDGKEGKEGKGKGRGPAAGKPAKFVPTNPNFRYIVRLADTDLDGTRSTALALTSVRGVGLRLAETTCRLTHVDPHEMIGNLPEPTVEGIETTLRSLPTQVPPWMVNHHTEPVLGESPHLLGPELDTRRRDDVNVMKMIRSYRGVRHERGQKVRGQRTRSNGRTGMAAGVLKKAAKEAAAAAGKEAPAAAPAAPAAAAAAPAEKKA
jgi:small subunit ribosomal protein S13